MSQSTCRTTRVHPTIDKPLAIHGRLQYAYNSVSTGIVHRRAPLWPHVMRPVSQIRASAIAVLMRRQRYPHRRFHPELGCWLALQVADGPHQGPRAQPRPKLSVTSPTGIGCPVHPSNVSPGTGEPQSRGWRMAARSHGSRLTFRCKRFPSVQSTAGNYH